MSETEGTRKKKILELLVRFKKPLIGSGVFLCLLAIGLGSYRWIGRSHAGKSPEKQGTDHEKHSNTEAHSERHSEASNDSHPEDLHSPHDTPHDTKANHAAADEKKSTEIVKEDSHSQHHADHETVKDTDPHTAPSHSTEVTSAAQQTVVSKKTILSRITDAYYSFNEKWDKLAKAETQNEVLLLENLNLKSRYETLQFDCRAREMGSHYRNHTYALTQETGSKVGRTLASIIYRPPSHLLPPQLHALGLSYFKAKEDEKAAVIFTILSGMENQEDYRTAKDYLLTGVSWYRIENFRLADHYFDLVLKLPEKEEDRPYFAQARLWRALAQKHLGNYQGSQWWLRELVDHHPRSLEASWVNTGDDRFTGEIQRSERKPSSETNKTEHSHH